jgi:hypothetical protein
VGLIEVRLTLDTKGKYTENLFEEPNDRAA